VALQPKKCEYRGVGHIVLFSYEYSGVGHIIVLFSCW